MLYLGLPGDLFQSLCCVLYGLTYRNVCYYRLQIFLYMCLVHSPKATSLCLALYGYEVWSHIQEKYAD